MSIFDEKQASKFDLNEKQSKGNVEVKELGEEDRKVEYICSNEGNLFFQLFTGSVMKYDII